MLLPEAQVVSCAYSLQTESNGLKAETMTCSPLTKNGQFWLRLLEVMKTYYEI